MIRYLVCGHSRNPLKMTKRTFERLMSYHQVMPAYFDLVSVFGLEEIAFDQRFSGFRDQTTIGTLESEVELNRSTQRIQLCYNLKAPFQQPNQLWTIRQAAIHHQFDLENGTALWIVTKGEWDPLKQRTTEATNKDGRPEDKDFTSVTTALRAALSIHILFTQWSGEDWRTYIRNLEAMVELKVR